MFCSKIIKVSNKSFNTLLTLEALVITNYESFHCIFEANKKRLFTGLSNSSTYITIKCFGLINSFLQLDNQIIISNPVLNKSVQC